MYSKEKVINAFRENGILASHAEKQGKVWQERQQQLDMAGDIYDTINSSDRNSTIVEAGTGVGKSFAYLLPILMSGKRAVIAAPTKALQDQLFRKDLPFIQDAVKFQFTFAVLKGRNEYLCLENIKKHTGESLETLDTYFLNDDAKEFFAWARETNTGKKEEAPKYKQFHEVSADSMSSTCGACEYRENCHYLKAKDKAFKSNVMVVNHHWLTVYHRFMDEETDVIVIDEAHAFEDNMRSMMQYKLTKIDLMRRLARVTYIDKDMRQLMADTLFDGRRESKFKPYKLSNRPERIKQIFARIAMQIKENQKEKIGEKNEEILANLKFYINKFAKVFDEFDPEHVYSFDGSGMKDEDINFTSFPVEMTKLAGANFGKARSLVLTSATLTVNKKVDHLNTFLPEMYRVEKPLELGSPFDYKNQGMLYIPNDLPGPSGRQMSDMIEKISHLVSLTNGRTLCLFTAISRMKECAEMLSDLGYNVLMQGDYNDQETVRRFKEGKNTVLVATKKFFEGIDISGDDLVQVILEKIPFDNPYQFMFSKMFEYHQKKGGNAFKSYSLPRATTALKQGVGRLIRTALDHGVVTVLDNRLMSQFKDMRKSLPPFMATSSIQAVEKFFAEREQKKRNRASH